MGFEKILTLTAETFDGEIAGSPVPMLVNFWADWCAPCHSIASLLDDLAIEYDGQVRFGQRRAACRKNTAGCWHQFGQGAIGCGKDRVSEIKALDHRKTKGFVPSHRKDQSARAI